MHNNQEKGPTMNWQILMRECKSTKGRLIEKAGCLQMVLMDLLMGMAYKQLVEVLIK